MRWVGTEMVDASIGVGWGGGGLGLGGTVWDQIACSSFGGRCGVIRLAAAISASHSDLLISDGMQWIGLSEAPRLTVYQREPCRGLRPNTHMAQQSPKKHA